MSKSTSPIADVTKTVYNSRVYEPSDDSFALVDALQQQLPHIVHQAPHLCVEIGSGSGYVSCSLACLLQHHCCKAFCIATDISPYAVKATKATLAAHQVTTVDVVQADLVHPLFHRLQQAVDILVFNPPYVPTPDEEVARGGIAAAWAGGNRGRMVIDRVLPMTLSEALLSLRRGKIRNSHVSHNNKPHVQAEAVGAAQVHKLLSRGGHFFMVTVPENDPQEILSMMATQGLHGSIVLTRRADEELLHILHVIKEWQGATAHFA